MSSRAASTRNGSASSSPARGRSTAWRVASIRELPWIADLLVVAAGAGELPAIIDECVESGRVGSAILIPGGAGETESSARTRSADPRSIARARRTVDGPVFLGPNCLGVQSRPGRYDTLFIPAGKLDPRATAPTAGSRW